VPDYNVAELAASLHGARRAALPIDLCIPIRLAPVAAGAPLRAAFLFSHVDDRLSVAELSASAQIPLPDAIASFRLLAELGLIELRGSAEAKAPPPAENQVVPGMSKSGLRPKV
jgi:hypothetical protein